MPGKVAYIMSRFPHLPETFILREMIALEKLGWQIELYPLIVLKGKVVHPEARTWLARVNRIPWISAKVLAMNLREMFRHPRLYFSLWSRVIRENLRNPKFLIRALILFPKSVLMADDFRRKGIDHIHAHYATHPALSAWIIHQLTGITYSITVHAHDIYVKTDMLAPKLRDSAVVIAISEFNREYVTNLLGPWVRDKVQIVHCGVEPDFYSYPAKIRKEESAFEIISVGSLSPYKGHDVLIKACEILKNRGLRYRCLIVGGGELFSKLNRLISEYGLQDHVILVGPQSQQKVAALLAGADCYVQASVITASGKMEGIPVALMEAMASRLPVVATAISGIHELVKDGETGWLIQPEDAVALANTLFHIYGSPGEARRRAILGHEWVVKEFALLENAKKLSAIFDELLSSSEFVSSQVNFIEGSPLKERNLYFKELEHTTGNAPLER